MPGIVGLITKMPREWAEPQLVRMVEGLRHESFYETGTSIDEPSGVYAGWAIRKSSVWEEMPLRNERGDVSLLFSGEEFPEPGIARRLKERGHVLDLEGPSYLIHLYEEDPTFPACLNGRFHGLLIDRARGTATLFNDRYGMDRIYYHESKEAFYFAAEAKAILAVRPELRRPDLRGLGEFVACGSALENRTIFDGVHVLPTAAAWIFRHGSIEEKTHYFQAQEWENQSPLDQNAYYRKLQEVFAQNLPRYFNGREPVGMSLTGGLDSRMIMAWQKSAPGSLPCYSFGGTYRECQDVLLARQVARVCGQSHEIIRVGEDFLSRFPRYAERTVYLTDGCADVSRSCDLFVNERAREIAPIRITGNYGSEVLRAVRGFKPAQPPLGLFRQEFLTHIRAASETYSGMLQTHPVSFAAFRQAPWQQYGLLSLEQTQLALRSPYLDNDLVRTAFRAPGLTFVNNDAKANNDVCLRLISDGNRALGRIRTDRGLGENGGGLTALASQALHNFTFKAEYAYDYGMPQWVAWIDHHLSKLHLERLFLGRHKFYHFRIWYRDALSEYVREMLLDRRTLSRPYLERKTLETMVKSHLKGDRNFTSGIHKVLTLELLHRVFFDSR